MIRDAELFVMSEDVLVEVIGRIRSEGWKIEMRPLAYRETDRAETIRRRVAQHLREELQVPDRLAGRTPDDPRSVYEVLGEDPIGATATASEKACAAARAVEDRDAAAADLLRYLTIERSLLAHEIAMHLGSRACPLTEPLARGLCELVEPEGERWRSTGLFREPLVPMPDDVSWRDRFLMFSGRDPHPLVEY